MLTPFSLSSLSLSLSLSSFLSFLSFFFYFIVHYQTNNETNKDEFPEQWEATSSHQLRSGTDMQYAFAYMYYMMSVEKEFDVDREFAKLDADGDGLLSVHELRTMITRVYPLPTSLEDWQHFEAILLNCSSLQPPMEQLGVAVGPEAIEVWVTRQLVRQCDELKKLLAKALKDKRRYKFELHRHQYLFFNYHVFD